MSFNKNYYFNYSKWWYPDYYIKSYPKVPKTNQDIDEEVYNYLRKHSSDIYEPTKKFTAGVDCVF